MTKSSYNASLNNIMFIMISWIIIALIMIVDMIYSSRYATTPTRYFYGDDHKHNGPTVLSIYENTTKQFVQAASNPLYDLFKSVHFIIDHNMSIIDDIYNSNTRSIQLFVNKERMVSYHESIQVSWSSSSDYNDNIVGHKNIVNNDDILALYCYSPSLMSTSNYTTGSTEMIDYSKPRDAATIRQALSSSYFHHTHAMQQNSNSYYEYDLNDNTWNIPSFPTIREEKCHFRLWRFRNKHDRTISNHDHQHHFFTNHKNNNYKKYKNRNLVASESSFLLLATSIEFQLPSLDTPTGIHLSLTNDPKQIVVQYTTGSSGMPFVKVIHPNSTVTIHLGSSTTYTNDDLCQYPANSTDIGWFIPPGHLHTVIINDLIPNTNYEYRVGLKKEGRELREGIRVYSEHDDKYHSFMTMPDIGSKEILAFIVYGDQGCPVDGWAMGANMSTNMVRRELDNTNSKFPIRAVHHFGDLSYARGNAHLWDAWLDMISIFTTRVPLLIGVSMFHN